MGEAVRQIEVAIAALQAQREVLGPAVVDLAVAPLRERLAALLSREPGPAHAAGLAPQQRRLVTVLFADIVGSTSLTQHLDPEDVHAVMDGTLARFTEIVQAHQGSVLQYAGDSMLAVFGATQAREDDADRAVAAGLALLAEGRRQGEGVLRRFGHAGFDVRLGVHTGPVLLGGGVDAEGSIRGMTVNIAARLEQAAPPGALRISHDTWRLVSPRFDTERQPLLQVKGRDEPLQSYLVQGPKAHAALAQGRGVEGLAFELVGRQAEQRQIETWLHAGWAAGPAALLVEAEAGRGKTALVNHVLAQARAAGRLASAPLRVRALPSGPLHSHGLLRDLLLTGLALDLADTPERLRQNFVAALRPALREAGAAEEEGEAPIHLLGHLIGLDFSASPHVTALREAGAALRPQALHAGRRWLMHLARAGGGLLLVVDDLQWLDDASLQFLAQLGQLPARDASLGLLLLARPALRERQPAAGPLLQWLDAGAGPVRVGPLALAEAGRLAASLLQPLRGDDAGLPTLLVKRAEGNPYFMEELVQMLLDEGALQRHAAGHWTVDRERLQAERVPTTLTGVLQARLDSLAPAERRALQQAAVAGPSFWAGAVQALDSNAPAGLAAVVARGLLRPDDAAGAEHSAAGRLAFQNVLMQQVVYATVLRPQRRLWHAQVGQWMSGLPAVLREEALVEIAGHFEEGGRAAEAAGWLLQAVQRDAARFAHLLVIAASGRALALLQMVQGDEGAPLRAAESAALRWQLLLHRQRSLRMLGRLDEQEAAMDALEALALARGSAADRATVALRRCVVLLARGDAPGCAARCAPARALAQVAGEAETEVSVCAAWVGALRSLGRFAEAEAVATEGLALARGHGLRMHESELLTALAAMATDRGDPLRALALLEQSLAIDVALGSRHTECAARINLGDALLRLGDFGAARPVLEQALQLTRAIGAQALESVALLNLAGAARGFGDLPAALAYAVQAQDQAAAAANHEYEAFAWIAVGHAALQARSTAAAAAAYGKARALLESIGLPHLAVEAQAGELRVALDRGDMGAVAALAGALGAHVARHGRQFEGTEQPLWIHASWCEALDRLAAPEAAAEWTHAAAALQRQLDQIGEPGAQAVFIAALPHHREIARRGFPAGVQP